MASPDLLHFLAQADPSSSVELELLKEQIKFLEKSNADLVGTFKFFIGIAGSSIALSVLAFWKNLNEAKKLINDAVKEAVDRRISSDLEQRIDDIQRAVLTETRVRETPIYYWTPKTGEPEPQEVAILKARGFARLKSSSSDELRQRFADVLIIDLNYCNKDEAKIEEILNHAAEGISNTYCLIPYFKGQSTAINKFRSTSPTANVLPANSPASLMGNVVDTVYFSYAQFEHQKR